MRILQTECPDLDRPLTGSDLSLETSALIHGNRDAVTGHREDLPSLRENVANLLFTAFSGNDQLHPRAENQRGAILEKGV